MNGKPQRLYLCHSQGRYGTNTYVPLSVGCIWAYARTFPEVTAAYEFYGFLYLKEQIEKAAARLDNPQLLGLAHYIWNAEWNKAFAQAVKERWPECKIIVGGVQVPDESPRILEKTPDFDFAIYGEGEGAFKDFLIAHANGGGYETCGSLIWRDGGTVRVNARRPFVDLSELRSPYLDGVFDDLWPLEPRWQVLQETNRGCGYECSFCAWGQAALNKVRPFPDDRVLAEIEWFGKNGVDYVDNADANYGVLRRDLALARVLADTKTRKYGYPRTFRTSFAKNSNETVWEIANILHGANMLKSVTLAMQSMDAPVLVNIKRKNIKFEKFGELLKRYEAAGIPTYTELILGLPGETLDTFLGGIDQNLEAGQHAGLFCYMNLMLENTEQHKPEYIKAHGLKTANMLAMLTHGTPDPSVVRERQEVVIETAAMPHADWKRAYLHMKTVEVFHAQGLLQDVAIALHDGHGVRYRDFYGALLDWCLAHPETVAGREMCGIRDLLDRALAGGPWDCVDSPRLGDISWPPEEFAFARICCELERFYDEIAGGFLVANYPGNDAHQAIHEQRRSIAGPGPGNEAEWAREVVWYGRRGRGAAMRKRKVP